MNILIMKIEWMEELMNKKWWKKYCISVRKDEQMMKIVWMEKRMNKIMIKINVVLKLECNDENSMNRKEDE